MKRFIILSLVLLLGLPVIAAHKYLEKDYQNYWCNACGGITEYRLNDGTRVDCLTDDYAVEFDFSKKWAESVGQSLYYGMKTKRTPAVVLIMEQPSDQKYFLRLKQVADRYGIQVFTMDSHELE